MRNRLRRLASLLLFFSILSAALPDARACGPFFIEAIFTHTKHPDMPLEPFARGRLGVLRPSYARSYLAAAYRQLQGVPFNTDERAALVAFWKERLDFGWNDETTDERESWSKARARVEGVGPAPGIDVFRGKDQYEYFLNCPPDAFTNAARTLEERITKYGAASAEMKAWVLAQDTVFTNCNEGAYIPESLSGADALLRADRAYQIAAALFYSTRFDEARDAFDEIASDAASPWRTSGSYLAARAMLRKASVGDASARAASLADAEGRFRAVVADPSLSAVHDSARRLLKLTRLRLRPDEMLGELSDALMRADSQKTLRQDLWDYAFLLDVYDPDEEEGASPAAAPRPRVEDATMTDWINTFQSSQESARAHAVAVWEKTGSPAWLVAAITKVGGSHESAGTLVAAAARIAPESPAFPSVSHHAARLLAEQGKTDEARAFLDDLLARHRTSFPPSAVNEILGQRMRLARDAVEFFKFAQRVPAALSYNEDGREVPSGPDELAHAPELIRYAQGHLMFDADAVVVMNRLMPLSSLIEAASNRELPAHLRRDIAVAAWVRSVLLDDRRAGRRLAHVLLELAPEMRGLLNDETSTKSAEARKFSALYAILKFPGTQPYVDAGIGRTTSFGEIDNYRDNWWCALEYETHATPASEAATAAEGETPAPPKPLESPAFLDAAQRQQAAREVERLAALGTAPNYLARLAVEWSQKFPRDRRVPEALHLAVKSTRYGCTDKETANHSKAAFDALHRRYPTSPWTKKTPFWFKDV
ncbi:MAG TPA: hypothetical protein VFX96_20280 [Pyrinomonadaceae bacterium]|nr:hypothetical protein [Pyrinomonadaceae bacterium]